MRTHCTDQRDLDGDGARSAPSGCCRDIPSGGLGVRSALLVLLAARDVAIQSRRSERVRGRVASTVRWSRSGRSVLAGSTSVPADRSGGALSSKRRAREQRCRRLRAAPLDSVEEPSGTAPYGGGHRAFSRAGYMGHLLVGTPGYQGRSRKGFGIRDDSHAFTAAEVWRVNPSWLCCPSRRC